MLTDFLNYFSFSFQYVTSPLESIKFNQIVGVMWCAHTINLIAAMLIVA